MVLAILGCMSDLLLCIHAEVFAHSSKHMIFQRAWLDVEADFLLLNVQKVAFTLCHTVVYLADVCTYRSTVFSIARQAWQGPREGFMMHQVSIFELQFNTGRKRGQGNFPRWSQGLGGREPEVV